MMREKPVAVFYAFIVLIAACVAQPVSQTTSLHLNNQKLSAIPDSVFTLTRLEYLSLGNSFVMYPPLSALSDNYSGSDSMNRIQEIPEAIGNLLHLKALDVSANNIQSLPESITKLKKLERLELCFNPRFDAKTEFETLQKMTWLKTLNIAATKNAVANARVLQQALPGTKIIATLEDMMVSSSTPGDSNGQVR